MKKFLYFVWKSEHWANSTTETTMQGISFHFGREACLVATARQEGMWDICNIDLYGFKSTPLLSAFNFYTINFGVCSDTWYIHQLRLSWPLCFFTFFFNFFVCEESNNIFGIFSVQAVQMYVRMNNWTTATYEYAAQQQTACHLLYLTATTCTKPVTTKYH